MKVLNLRCEGGHVFEGWFASDDAFVEQKERGAIECPLCGDTSVSRLPGAPRLHLAGSRSDAPPAADPALARQAHWMKLARHVIDNTEDVGHRFPEEARRIHYGEVGARGIRGQASAEERQALHDEGIEIVPLPIPAAIKGPVQ